MSLLTAHDTALSKLSEPFAPEDIEWRVGQTGISRERRWIKVLAYVTNRAIMQRLDEIVGPTKWKNEYDKAPDGGVLCGISIKVGDEWVTKWDGASNTDIESTKGGLSNAMKRAGVQWGIGRYLYDLKESFVEALPEGERGAFKNKDKETNKWYSWNPPDLPKWALPKKEAAPPKK